jgi:hypothetical protein
MIEHPASIQEISHEWLAQSLSHSGFMGDAELRSFESEPFDPGAGQLSAITRIRLEYDRPTQLPNSLILKFHAPTKAAHEVSMRYRAYEREHRFFSEVAVDSDLPVPKCYGSLVDAERERYILVLEDMGSMEFVDQIEGASVEHAARVIKGLARLHASTWNRDAIARMAWMQGVDGEVNRTIIPADFERNWPRYWEKYGPTNPEGSFEIGETLSRSFDQLLTRQAELSSQLGILSICHGDSRLDNLAFDRDGDGVYLFDWQLSFKNLGPTDVSYFLGGSLDVELRRKHEEELLRLYFDELRAHGVEGLSFERLWDIYRLGHLYYLCYMVTGGTETDVSNARSFKLFQTASHRQFSAALDHASLEVAAPGFAFAT